MEEEVDCMVERRDNRGDGIQELGEEGLRGR